MNYCLEPTPEIIEGIVGKLKTNGMFDEMRRNCLADIDTKPAFQNLKQRVENYVNALLSTETWGPTLNKNQLRSKVRTSVMRSGMLNTGIDHILHQVVDAKMYTEFLPKISDYLVENNDMLLKEFTPQPEVELEQEAEVCIKQNENENLDDENTRAVDEEVLSPEQNIIKTGKEENSSDGGKIAEVAATEEEKEIPDIPENAASTLRNFLQSLMTSDIQSLLTKEDAHETEMQKTETKTSHTSGNSPTIDPSQIEAFTDEENNSDSELESPKPSKVGPRTPEELESDSPPGQSNYEEGGSLPDSPGDQLNDEKFNSDEREQTVSTSSSDNEDGLSNEDLRKVHSDASFESGGENDPKSDCEIAVDERDSSVEDAADEDRNDQCFSYDDGQINIIDMNESFEGEALEEVEVVEFPGAALEGECVVLDDQAHVAGEIQDIAIEAEVAEEDLEVQQHFHSREKKRRHKKHRRRRRSSTEQDSDASARPSSASDRASSGDNEVAEVVRSRSRKKKKKKLSKKHKRSKLKVRESSQEVLQWESSSEYRRSSLSPLHPDVAQRHFFVPSPQPHSSVRFEEDNRSVKVEPAFAPTMPPRFRDPYSVDRGLEDFRPPVGNIDHPFPMGHRDEGMVFPSRPSFLPRSPPHFPPHLHPRFSPPRFSSGHPRFSPPYSRGPYHVRPGSPPPRRYSPTFEYFRPPPPRQGFDGPAIPRSPPPHHRRFSPPLHLMGRFPGGIPPPRPFPGPPHEERFMLRPSGPGPRGIRPGNMMRADMPGPPQMDMRRPPLR